MSGTPNSSSGGGGGLFKALGAVARTFVEQAVNNTVTATANVTGTVQASRSFFNLNADAMDAVEEAQEVIEYAGKSASNDVATIYPIHLRAGELILHGPKKSPEGQDMSHYSTYNIILHFTNGSKERMYSLFRCEDETEATRTFVIFKQIFPDLIKASPSPMDQNMIERIVKLSKRHESYFGVHIAAALNMTEHLKSPNLREKYVEQEGSLLQTPLHVACVHANFNAFKVIIGDERLFLRIFDIADLKGNTVIHLAAACKDQTVASAILKLFKKRIYQLPSHNLHTASNVILNQFLTLNNEGLAAMHIACSNNNKEAVEELSTVSDTTDSSMDSTDIPVAHMNLLDIKAASTGNTPLHYATSNPPILSHLLSKGSDPNITDNEGLTPLHKAVLESNLKSTLQLLSNNAYPNLVATFNGYVEATPLHMAAYLGAVDCLKALIVFGADMEMKDKNGHTPRHIVASIYNGSNTTKQDAIFVLAAAGAQRCGIGIIGGCTEGCKSGGKNNGKKPDKWRLRRDGTSPPIGVSETTTSLVQEAMQSLSIVKESIDTDAQQQQQSSRASGTERGPVIGGRLLSLDGGGIRGLVLTQMLFFMEKEFSNVSGSGGSPIISYFDWVAGTSTGGILALSLASGKSVLETQSLYVKLKDKVFTGSRPYSATRMEEFLKKEFGAESKMSSIQKPRVMIMTSLANRRPPDLYIFRNYMSPSSLLGEPEEHAQHPNSTYIWETAKVTGAAPSYFTLDHEIFIDGGLISNNPTLDALTELTHFKAVMMGSQQRVNGQGNGSWKLPALVLSLGTGITPPQLSSATNLDIAWPTGVFEAVRNVPRLSQMINLLVDQATQAEGQVVERSRAWCTSTGVPFFRFSPEMSVHIELDEKEDDAIVNLMWETWCYMVGNKTVVRELYERLCGLDISSAQDAMEVP